MDVGTENRKLNVTGSALARVENGVGLAKSGKDQAEGFDPRSGLGIVRCDETTAWAERFVWSQPLTPDHPPLGSNLLPGLSQTSRDYPPLLRSPSARTLTASGETRLFEILVMPSLRCSSLKLMSKPRFRGINRR